MEKTEPGFLNERMMASSLLYKALVAFCILCCLSQFHVSGEEPEMREGEEKRQHNIMRFGKRPSSPGHSLIRFGKRLERTNLPHSYLFFGKRDSDDTRNNLSDFLRYLQRNPESSWKRGHNIMRFGKRADNHHFIRFGKREGLYPNEDALEFDGNLAENENERQGYESDEDIKRNGHSMMYFGKRDGHSMLYFGKRGAHSMIHFGKRGEVSDDGTLNEAEDKRAHSMIHFGKRLNEDDALIDNDSVKRAHSMIHFGKRESDDDQPDIAESEEQHEDLDSQDKRGSHSMIHFGKRDENEEQNTGADEDLSQWIHKSGPLGISSKRYHSLLRFGKRFMESSSSRDGGHSMIHFGKRPDNRRAHSMIHFGKRSVQEVPDVKEKNSSPHADLEKSEHLSDQENHGKRLKRQVNTDDDAMMSLMHYTPEFPEVTRQAYYPNAYSIQNVLPFNGLSEGKSYLPEFQQEEQELPLFFTRQVRSDWIGKASELSPDKRENSKNVFLRFGRR